MKSFTSFGYLLGVAGKSENTHYSTMRAAVPGNCLGSVDGWLTFMDHIDIYFLNPVSVSTNRIPPLSFLQRLHRSSVGIHAKVVASSAPDLSGCLVAAHVVDPNCRRLAFRNYRDKSWTLIDANDEFGRGMLFQDLAVYVIFAVTLHGASDFVMVFDVKESNAVKTERLVMLDPKPVRSRSLAVEENGDVYYRDSEVIYVVKDSESGEIMLVFQLNDLFLCPTSVFWIGNPVSGVEVISCVRAGKSRPR